MEDDGVPFDRCVEVKGRAGDVVDEVVVNLGLSGDVNVDLRLAALTEDVDDVEVFRKTRAGGNWLTGGMLRMCRC